MMSTQNSKCALRSLSVLALSLLLGACGGGSGGSFDGSGNLVLPTVAQKCSPNNPYRADASSATSPGSLSDEKAWLLSYMDAAYLWYREIPTVNASAASFSNEALVYTSLDNYFDALRTPALTASGAKKDRFSFTYPTRDWQQLSQSGKVLGYGIEWSFSPKVPRNITVVYVEPGSPAALAGVLRGDRLLSADGASSEATTQAEIDILNGVLFPSLAGNHQLIFSRQGQTLASKTLAAGEVSKQPVLLSQTLDVGGQRVGYLVFNDHIATAEQPLINSINQFRADQVSDLVLDLRYNGGGYLYLASELAYMIAGAARTNGKVFERLQYNEKRGNDTAQAVTGFYNTSCHLDASGRCTLEQSLPSLNLGRVYVLSSANTCSASEAIVNGLRGIDVDVQLIGGTSCGKPYGFTAKDNCGISYFPIEFEGRNAKGVLVNPDGEAATCAASDDLNKALGDQTEGMLAAALYKRANGSCKPVPAAMRVGAAEEGRLQRVPARENAIYLPRR